MVFQNEVKYAEYDQKDLLDNDLLYCLEDYPILEDHYDWYYNNMDFFYDRAISHLQDGIQTDCSDASDTTSDKRICGGSETFEYDERVHYIKKLILQDGPPATETTSDGYYEFGCFTSFSDWDSPNYGQYMYPGECLVDLSMMLELYQLFNPDDDDPNRQFTN